MPESPAGALGAVLADELARHGLTDAVIAPGSRSAPLAYALAADERVRLHVRHDERSAAFLALGLALGSGRPVAVVCTSGTAAANLHPAVVEADLAGVPLLVLTADRPPELRGTGANQTIDQLHLYGRSVRWFAEVGVPEGRAQEPAYWRSLAARAWGEAGGALGGPPGPVHLNCPLREPLQPGPRPGSWPEEPAWAATRRAPVTADLTDEAQTPRGVVVAGAGAPDGLPALAAATGWPLLAEPHSGARVGDQAVTSYDALLRSEAFSAVHRPDVAVIGGKPGLSRALQDWLEGVRQVVVHRPGRPADPARQAVRLVAADRVVADGGGGGWAAVWLAADQAAAAAIDGVLDADDTPNEPRLARDLGALLPDGAVLVAASSMPIRDLDAFLRPRGGLRVVANRGASGVDGFVSTAAGVALSHQGPAFALSGDLSLLHDAGGLLTPPGSPRPDLVVVVANNDGGAIFSLLPHAGHPDFERLFGTPHGVEPSALAAAYGCGHQAVRLASDLPAALRQAGAAGGVQLVEIRTERAANAALHRRLLAAVSDAVQR